MTREEQEELAAGLENAARVSWRWAQARPAEREYQLGVAQRLAASARDIREHLERGASVRGPLAR